jgi:serine/threonine-protein kinase
MLHCNVGAPLDEGVGPALKDARKRLLALIGLIAVVASAAAVLIGTLSQMSASKSAETTPTQTSGPKIDGTYRVDYDANAQSKNGTVTPADPVPAFAWSFQSACPDTGCVATAIRLRDGGTDLKVVLDFLDGHWVETHMAEAGTCPGGGTAPHLVAWSLAPGPGDTFTGTQTDMYMGNVCTTVLQTPITLTRIGNAATAGISPASLPPLVASAPQGLHGQYTYTETPRDDSTGGNGAGNNDEPPKPYPVDVRTYCARNSDNCASLMTSRADVGRDRVQAYQFTVDRWTWGVEVDGTCTAGDVVKGAVHQKLVVDLPLPQPNSDPIAKLTGSAVTTYTGDCGDNATSDVSLDRIGD